MKPIQESAMNGRGDNHTTHPAGLRREKEGKMEQRNKIPKTCVECDFLEYKSGEFVCTRLPHDTRDFIRNPIYIKHRRADCPLEDSELV